MRSRVLIYLSISAVLFSIALLSSAWQPERARYTVAEPPEQPDFLQPDKLREKIRAIEVVHHARIAGTDRKNTDIEWVTGVETAELKVHDPDGRLEQKRRDYEEMIRKSTFVRNGDRYENRQDHIVAAADPNGFSIAFASDDNLRLKLGLATLTQGETTYGGESVVPASQGNTVSWNLGEGITEKYIATEGKTQYLLVLDRPLEGEGDLVVSTPVETNLKAKFNPGLGFVDHGDRLRFKVNFARVLDSDGKIKKLAIQYKDDQIRLVIPEGWLAEASYPIVVDPVLVGGQSEIMWPGNGFPNPPVVTATDDTEVGVSFDSTNNRYLICWSRPEPIDAIIRWVVLDNTGANLTLGGGGMGGIGSAGADSTVPKAAYSATSDRHMMAYRNDFNAGAIFFLALSNEGQWLNSPAAPIFGTGTVTAVEAPDGVRSAAAATLDDTDPDLAWNSANDEFMATWSFAFDALGDYDVGGAGMAFDATALPVVTVVVGVVGTYQVFVLSAGNDARPGIAYSPTTAVYCAMASTNLGGGDPDVTGSVFSHDFTTLINNVNVGFSFNAEEVPDVAWNSDDDEFGVAFADNTAGSYDVFIRRVSTAGVLVAAAQNVATEVSIEYRPSLAYNSNACGYFVCWDNDLGGGQTTMEGAMVTPDGTQRSDVLDMNPTVGGAGTLNLNADCVSNDNGANQRIVAAWEGNNSGGNQFEIFVDFIDCNVVPTQVSNPVPADGAINIPVGQVLSWDAATDPDGPNGDLVYDVYLDTVNPPVTLVSADQPGLSYDPGGLNTATTYFWRVDSKDPFCGVTAGPVWTFSTAAIAPVNNPPANIPAVNLIQSDDSLGAAELTTYVDNDGNLFFRAVVTDPDAGQQVALQVEVKATGVVFDGSGIQTGNFVASGGTSEVAHPALANGTYHWRARAIDNQAPALTSVAWTSFGANLDPGDTDFTVTVAGGNNPPAAPILANLIQSDDSLSPSQPTTYVDNDGNLFMRSIVTDPDAGDQVALQVEVKATGVAFDGTTGITTGSFVASGGTSEVAYPSLANGTYHWRARAIDNAAPAATSAWTSFGGNADPGATDFTVTMPVVNAPPNAPTALQQHDTMGGPAIPVGTLTTINGFVEFQANVTDPDNDLCALQVEVRLIGVPFTGAITATGNFVASGSNATVSVVGLTVGDYQWRVRTLDQPGLNSGFVDFGGNASNPPTNPAGIDFTSAFVFVGPTGSRGSTDTNCSAGSGSGAWPAGMLIVVLIGGLWIRRRIPYC